MAPRQGASTVSVAIPAYNQEGFIAAALDSVLGQEYSEMEIVVGDDGSTDRTPEILEEYRRRHPDRLKLLRSPINRGITQNCNSILAACDGDYIAWLGGDDLFKPGKVAMQARALDAHPEASICHHPVEWFDSASGATISVVNSGARSWRNAEELIRRGNFGSCASVMHRRAAAPAHGFRRELAWASDWPFFIELALAGEVVVIDQPLARYRHHPRQFSVGNSSTVVFEDAMRTMEIVESEGLADRRTVARGRANVLHWHAVNLIGIGANRSTIRKLLLRGIRYDPTYVPLWRRLIEAHVGRAKMDRARTLRSRLMGSAPAANLADSPGPDETRIGRNGLEPAPHDP